MANWERASLYLLCYQKEAVLGVAQTKTNLQLFRGTLILWNYFIHCYVNNNNTF